MSLDPNYVLRWDATMDAYEASDECAEDAIVWASELELSGWTPEMRRPIIAAYRDSKEFFWAIEERMP